MLDDQSITDQELEQLEQLENQLGAISLAPSDTQRQQLLYACGQAAGRVEGRAEMRKQVRTLTATTATLACLSACLCFMLFGKSQIESMPLKGTQSTSVAEKIETNNDPTPTTNRAQSTPPIVRYRHLTVSDSMSDWAALEQRTKPVPKGDIASVDESSRVLTAGSRKFLDEL